MGKGLFKWRDYSRGLIRGALLQFEAPAWGLIFEGFTKVFDIYCIKSSLSEHLFSLTSKKNSLNLSIALNQNLFYLRGGQ